MTTSGGMGKASALARKAGSDTTPGCHTRRNTQEKARKAKALERRAAEDAADPAGAEQRQKKRAQESTRSEVKHKARMAWLAAMCKLQEVEGTGASLSSSM